MNISAFAISGIGVSVVFSVLIVLAVVVKLIGLLLQQSKPSPRPLVDDSNADHEQLQRDIAIITAIMKSKGYAGNLTIKQIK